MEYLIIAIVLLLFMLGYFRIAKHYNIIDKPNHRSAHKEITLRGGGIVFPLAFILYILEMILFSETKVATNFELFGIGILSIATISFIDDIYDLSSKIRLIVHFLSVTFLMFFLHLFEFENIFWIIPIYVFIIGILNAYNFMDGINGITGLYSLISLVTFYFINQQVVTFTDKDFIIYPIIASLVFLFFNFRKKAKCFAGDVGSLSIAFWIIALNGLLILKTMEFKFLFFLLVYGVEVVLTIIQRLYLRQNIFEAHRHHLYQLLVNELKWSHLVVAFTYSFLQLLINIIILFCDLSFFKIIVFIGLPLSIFYIYVKYLIYYKKGVY